MALETLLDRRHREAVGAWNRATGSSGSALGRAGRRGFPGKSGAGTGGTAGTAENEKHELEPLAEHERAALVAEGAIPEGALDLHDIAEARLAAGITTAGGECAGAPDRCRCRRCAWHELVERDRARSTQGHRPGRSSKR
jgi:hypothetical protein